MRLGPTSSGSLRTLAVMLLRTALQGTLLILLARYLGTADFGVFAAVASLALGFGMLVSLGQNYLVSIHSALSAHLGQDTLSGALPLTAISAVALIPVYAVTAALVLPSSTPAIAIALIGLAELLFAPLSLTISKRFHGLGHVPSSQAIHAIPVVFRLIGLGVCLLITPKNTLIAYAAVYLLAVMVASSVVAILAARMDILPTRYRWPSIESIKSGLPYAGMRFSMLAPNELDKVVAPAVLAPLAAGSYALVSRCLGFLILPVQALVTTGQPRIGTLLQANPHRASRLSIAILLVSVAYGAAAGLGLWWMGTYVLSSLTDGGFPDLDTAVRTLAWACLPLSVRYAAGGLLIPLQRPMQRVAAELTGLAVLVCLMPILAHGRGLMGAALAVVASEAVMAIMLVTLTCNGLRSKPKPTDTRVPNAQ